MPYDFIDDSPLVGISAVGDHKVQSSSQNVIAFNGAAGPGPAIEPCHLINVTGQSVFEGVSCQIGRAVEIDALDAGHNAVLEPIDDRKVTWKIMA